jgi:hypothetical protein
MIIFELKSKSGWVYPKMTIHHFRDKIKPGCAAEPPNISYISREAG